MWNLIHIQSRWSAPAFENIFDHFLELRILAVVMKLDPKNKPEL